MNRKKRIAIIVIFIIVMVGGYFFMEPMVRLVSNPDKIRRWVQDRGMWGVLAFACMNMLQVMIALVPGGPFSLSAGYVFGPVKGTLLCVLSCSIASAIVFQLVKRHGRSLVSVFVTEKQLSLLDGYGENEEISKKIEHLLMLIFVVPGSPKDPLTYLAGLTQIPLHTWILVNIIGRIPGTGITAFGGSALGSGKVVSIIAVVGGVLALFLVSKGMKKIIKEK